MDNNPFVDTKTQIYWITLTMFINGNLNCPDAFFEPDIFWLVSFWNKICILLYIILKRIQVITRTSFP